MNENRRFFITVLTVLALLTVLVFPVTAQDKTNPTAFLVYYDDDFELEVFDSSGGYVGEVFTGMELFPGATIKTYNTTAEIQLEPNGSILKISENSVFQIEAFQRAADESNDFSLFNGKLRVIAARAGLGYENYSIITQSAVCGVRGTDLVIDSIGVLAVLDGAVSFSSLLSGETINVISGQIADVFADTFAATTATAQSLASIFSGMDFTGADPAQVPGHTVSPEPAGEPADEDTPADEPAGEDTPADEPAGGDTADNDTAADSDGKATADTGTKDSPAQPKASGQGSAAANITGRGIPSTDKKPDTEEAAAEPSVPGPFDEFFEGIADMLAFEIGSVTVDGTTYAKAVIQPEFAIGDLQMGLYLPVIYQDNLFDPATWYKPAGNNEWSFGTDQIELGNILLDIMSDLFLKIKYIQWGDNGDDFYLKFGNLDNMSIGHGILMYNFANNNEFPAIRKVGINTGFNFDYFGLEAVLDDAADPTIFGGRFVYMPFGPDFPLGIGLSAITDINPDSELEDTTVLWNTMILNGAIDLGLPIELLGMTLFTDLAALTLFDETGWHWDTIYNSAEPDFMTALNNFGVSAGVYGDFFTIDYRLEYRLSKGLFRSSFYNSGYLVNKTEYFNELTTYTAAPGLAAYQDITMGVYGELSANFFDAVTLKGGYLWPWVFDGTAVSFEAEDNFHIALYLMPDIIPVVGLYGSISYSRDNLVGSIADAVAGTTSFQLFDDNTVFTGELVYPFDDFLDIAMQFATALSRDENGNIIFTDGVADIYYAFTIDTRIHF
ncbi:MAG: FecR domain-containing protein [Spirochaetales bacterium]|nr:FecR domain-containing protein [Spirochaetales bacterium]